MGGSDIETYNEKGLAPSAAHDRGIASPGHEKKGDLWVDDRASFFDVTVAVSRLRAIIHDWLEMHPQPGSPASEDKRSIMLAKLHSEAHSIGLVIADWCFRSAGWIVSGGEDRNVDERLFEDLRARPFAVLGLSVGSDTPEEELRRTIEAAKAQSMNAALKVCIGGAYVSLNDNICERVGADFAVKDALEAVQTMEATIG